jgi:hypothetical protein
MYALGTRILKHVSLLRTSRTASYNNNTGGLVGVITALYKLFLLEVFRAKPISRRLYKMMDKRI